MLVVYESMKLKCTRSYCKLCSLHMVNWSIMNYTYVSLSMNMNNMLGSVCS